MLAGFIFLILSMAAASFAQENKALSDRLLFLSSEGLSCSWLTRIIKQTGRSNFVFEDFLPGMYYRMDMRIDMPIPIKITPMVRVAALYPLTSTFNKFPQKPKTPLHFGADMNLGINFDILDFAYFRLNAGPAAHLFFLNSDRWNYFNLGASVFVGMELPIAERWTLICSGYASLDNGNLGNNRNIEKFDIAYQYQIDIGARYSKKLKNRAYLFPVKRPAKEVPHISR
jgi:hypothetical protein